LVASSPFVLVARRRLNPRVFSLPLLRKRLRAAILSSGYLPPQSIPGTGLHCPPQAMHLFGFVPLQRSQTWEPASPGFASPSTFRPQSFSLSRRFSSPTPLRPCCMPVALLGFHQAPLVQRSSKVTLRKRLLATLFRVLSRAVMEVFDHLVLPWTYSHGRATAHLRAGPSESSSRHGRHLAP
jgi:hypothetical protein